MCSNAYCAGHPSYLSPACYTCLNLQTSQVDPESVWDSVRAKNAENIANTAVAVAAIRDGLVHGTSIPELDEESDENLGPFVFRRPPRPRAVGYDDEWDTVLGIAAEAEQTPAKEAEMLIAAFERNERLNDYQDSRARAADLLELLKEPQRSSKPEAAIRAYLNRLSAVKDRLEQERMKEYAKRAETKERRKQLEKKFIAEKAACFAQEEEDLTKKEDLYQIRDLSEDPQPPLATTMQDLAERDTLIEARRRRVIAHEYRNSVVTSTTTPNLPDPAKTSLENPIIYTAIDQFLTQDTVNSESLEKKLETLYDLAVDRAKKLGIEGANGQKFVLGCDDAQYFEPTSPIRWSGDEDQESLYSRATVHSRTEPLPRVGGKRAVECADAISARCQHHTCQPIRIRRRPSFVFSETTSYGPLLKDYKTRGLEQGEKLKASETRRLERETTWTQGSAAAESPAAKQASATVAGPSGTRSKYVKLKWNMPKREKTSSNHSTSSDNPDSIPFKEIPPMTREQQREYITNIFNEAKKSISEDIAQAIIRNDKRGIKIRTRRNNKNVEV